MKNLLVAIALAMAGLGYSEEKAPAAHGNLTPETPIFPSDVNGLAKWDLVLFERAMKKVNAIPGLNAQQKADVIAEFKGLRKNVLVTNDFARKYTPLAFVLNICGGSELSLGMFIPNRVEFVTPGVQADLCAAVVTTMDGGTGNWNLPTAGLALLAGGQIERPQKDKEGRNINKQFEGQFIASIIVPLTRQTGISKFGDLQGAYVGGTGQWAFEGPQEWLSNVKTGGFSIYIKFDWKKRPEALMFNITKTKSKQNTALGGQLEVFWYVASSVFGGDHTEYLLPNWLNEMIFKKPNLDSPHRRANRERDSLTPEVQQLLNDPEVREMLKQENVEKLMIQSQQILHEAKIEARDAARLAAPAVETDAKPAAEPAATDTTIPGVEKS